MSFLDGMFGGLDVATKVVTADTTVVLGWLYRVRAPGDVTLSLTPAPLAQASGQRLAAKVVEAGAGVVTVAVPAGMLIEADDGTRALTATLEQALGNYREWLCDPNGNWLP